MFIAKANVVDGHCSRKIVPRVYDAIPADAYAKKPTLGFDLTATARKRHYSEIVNRSYDSRLRLVINIVKIAFSCRLDDKTMRAHSFLAASSCLPTGLLDRLAAR